jgi:hypothetical protein
MSGSSQTVPEVSRSVSRSINRSSQKCYWNGPFLVVKLVDYRLANWYKIFSRLAVSELTKKVGR